MSLNLYSVRLYFQHARFTKKLNHLKEIKIRGDTEVHGLEALLDRAWGLKRLESRGLQPLPQVCAFNYQLKMPNLNRVCISAPFSSEAKLEHFLIETMSNLDYLELSICMNISDSLLVKCS